MPEANPIPGIRLAKGDIKGSGVLGGVKTVKEIDQDKGADRSRMTRSCNPLEDVVAVLAVRGVR
jgi:hypothetical protein